MLNIFCRLIKVEIKSFLLFYDVFHRLLLISDASQNKTLKSYYLDGEAWLDVSKYSGRSDCWRDFHTEPVIFRCFTLSNRLNHFGNQEIFGLQNLVNWEELLFGWFHTTETCEVTNLLFGIFKVQTIQFMEI